MKNIDKLFNKLKQAEANILKIAIELKDTSVKSGKYYSTVKANTNGYLIFRTIKRTEYLNTYICVDRQHEQLLNDYNSINSQYNAELDRLRNLRIKKWQKESVINAINMVEEQIKYGTINTSYAKILVVGNNNIYFAHPVYQHEDYNKFVAMRNTPKNRKLATELNNKLRESGLNF